MKHFVIDGLHKGNHKYKKKHYTRAEARRFKDTRTNMSESFNAWIHPLNFFLNGLRPSSHRFGVKENIDFYNSHLAATFVKPMSRRSNVASRKDRRKK